MSDLIATIAALVVSALLGACVGFVAARRFPDKVERHERTAEQPAVVHPPITAPAIPPTRAIVASHIVETELTDAEIDALPADLPFLAHARPRIASPPKTRTLNRL
jgi:hypothetical protein